MLQYKIDEKTTTIGAQGYVDIPVTLTRTNVDSGEAGLNILTAVIKDDEGVTSLTSDLVTVEYNPEFTGDSGTGNATDTVRINAGGDAFTDIQGNIWFGDRNSNGGAYSKNIEIAGTTNDNLYQTERFTAGNNSLSYDIPLENGDYQVTLKFAEIYFNDPGKRIFDVAAEEQTAIDNLDIFAEAGGKNIALDRTFTTSVADGVLNLDFIAEIENAKVSAIEVVPIAEIIGSAGNDTINGSTNTNIIDGGAGTDFIDYRDSNGGVTIDLGTGTADGGDAVGDTIRQIENVFGSQFGDRITGDAQNNVLRGFNGNDTLDGGAGNDRINGGIGVDVLDGGAGIDVLDYHTFNRRIEVNLLTATVSDGDTISNFENVFGSQFGDRLTGDAQSNTLRGLDGNDTLSGGGGKDFLNGGTGNDTFTLTKPQDSLLASFDTITDFNTAADLIDAPTNINTIDDFGTISNFNRDSITEIFGSKASPFYGDF